MRIPPGPWSNTSRSSQRPSTTSARVNFGVKPSKTSTFASPRSASINRTRLPSSANAMDKLTDTLVLPTPPLPPVTAITCTGCMLPMIFLYLVLLRRGYMRWLLVPQRNNTFRPADVGTLQRNLDYLSRPAWVGCGRYQRTYRPWPLRWVLPAFAHSLRGSPTGDAAADEGRPESLGRR